MAVVGGEEEETQEAAEDEAVVEMEEDEAEIMVVPKKMSPKMSQGATVLKNGRIYPQHREAEYTVKGRD